MSDESEDPVPEAKDRFTKQSRQELYYPVRQGSELTRNIQVMTVIVGITIPFGGLIKYVTDQFSNQALAAERNRMSIVALQEQIVDTKKREDDLSEKLDEAIILLRQTSTDLSLFRKEMKH